MLPYSSLVDLARNPVPGGAQVGLFQSFDGLKLRYALWAATRAPLRGTVVIVPGRSEFIEKYFETVADLRRRGFAVAVMDLRGQGGSERLLGDTTKGHVRNFRDYERDLDGFVSEIVRALLPEPYIALGHSLGGHILLRRALSPEFPFSRLVLTAPMIRIAGEALGMSAGVARAFAETAAMCGGARRFVPGGSGAGEAKFEGNVLTSDPERFARAQAVLKAAPELAIGAPTIGWMKVAFRSMAQLQHPDTPRSISVPMLVAMAGEDKIVSTTAVEDFALRTKLASRVLIPSSRHEILQETDDIRARFWAAFDAYFVAAAEAA